ncbi:hypothetical protein FACS1894218_6010 [Bacilli bacterium]|nr:hypothetical protein FACS1894218_6010 [Bacilli bacterium]
MGAFFAVGSSVTAALVCSAPNYVITSVEVKEFLPTNVTAYAGVAGESPAFIYAVVNGYSQRGGQQHIFFN